MTAELQPLRTNISSLVIADLGGRPITLGGLVAALVILVVAWLVARLIAGGLCRVRTRLGEGGGALYIVEKLGSYGVIIAGASLALSTLGLDLSSFAVFAGAIGVGVGLGLQGIVKEFVSGLVLIFDRAMNVGDFVELEEGKRGVVQEIGPRAVRVRTNDDIDITIPNSKFIEGPVVNWTLHDQGRRISIPF